MVTSAKIHLGITLLFCFGCRHNVGRTLRITMLFLLWSFVYSLLFWWLICSGYEPVVYRARGTRGRLCHSRVTCFESVGISECLGDESDKSARFQKPTTVIEIEQRERDRIDHFTVVAQLPGLRMKVRLPVTLFWYKPSCFCNANMD